MYIYHICIPARRGKDGIVPLSSPSIMGDSCPRETLFYVCQLNSFRGCCSIDPCSRTDGCPDTQTSSAMETSTQSPDSTSSVLSYTTPPQNIGPSSPFSVATSPSPTSTWPPTSQTSEGSGHSLSPSGYRIAIGAGLGVTSFVLLLVAGIILLYRRYTPYRVKRSCVIGQQIEYPKPIEPVPRGYVELAAVPYASRLHPTVSELPEMPESDVNVCRLPQSPQPCATTCIAGSCRATLAATQVSCKHEELVTSWENL
ncbi:hypothetical protein GGR57DRAFT_451706 [Xylariaceae sp. FL1272]|nr:hypothetical protein GGR57DRAFT_451706 [Xylariaceae sp. FL1272]